MIIQAKKTALYTQYIYDSRDCYVKSNEIYKEKFKSEAL